MTKNQPPGRSPDNQYPELADELERVLNLMLDSGEACRVDGDFDEWIDFTHGVSLALRLDVIAERSGTSTEGNLAGRDQDDHTVYLESALITAVAALADAQEMFSVLRRSDPDQLKVLLAS